MSNSHTVDRPIPPGEAWPLESRKQMMRHTILTMARHCDLSRVNPQCYAATYGVPVIDVEAEMMKHLSEGEAK